MRELHKLDQVAYVRFASVYRSFKDVGEFMRELQDLIKERQGGRRCGSGRRVGLAEVACRAFAAGTRPQPPVLVARWRSRPWPRVFRG